MKKPSTTSPSKVIIIPRPSSGTKPSSESAPQKDVPETPESTKAAAEDIPVQQLDPQE